jgi:hypothetical protein
MARHRAGWLAPLCRPLPSDANPYQNRRSPINHPSRRGWPLLRAVLVVAWDGSCSGVGSDGVTYWNLCGGWN